MLPATGSAPAGTRPTAGMPLPPSTSSAMPEPLSPTGMPGTPPSESSALPNTPTSTSSASLHLPPTGTTANKPVASFDKNRTPKLTDNKEAPSLRQGGSLRNNTLPVNYGALSSKKARQPLHQIVIMAKNLLEAEQQRKSLTQYDFSIKSRKNLSHLGLFLSTFQLPESISLEDAQSLVFSIFPDASAEPNIRFSMLGMDIKRYGQTMMNLPTPSPCQNKVPIAVIDSLVSPSVIQTRADNIEIIDVTGSQPASDLHGTAIVNLLVSNDEKYQGVLPNAHIYAINVFSQEDDSLIETKLDWLLYGFNALAGLTPKPAVANLSFGGQYSAMLEQVASKISKTIPLVAAAGNSGTNELVYPAALDSVIAVGSINARGKRAKDSNFGPHVNLFAPGEDIWTLNNQGEGFFARGTSYAAPFAAAAIALINSEMKSLNTYFQSLHPTNTISFTSLCHQ